MPSKCKLADHNNALCVLHARAIDYRIVLTEAFTYNSLHSVTEFVRHKTAVVSVNCELRQEIHPLATKCARV